MSDLFDNLQTFYQNNTEITIAILVAIALALIIKPKAAGKIVGAIAILLVIGYLIVEVINLTDSTMDKKGEAASRTDREFQQADP